MIQIDPEIQSMIDRITELQNELDAYTDEQISRMVKQLLVPVFADGVTKSVSWVQSAPNNNDGDPTDFSIQEPLIRNRLTAEDEYDKEEEEDGEWGIDAWRLTYASKSDEDDDWMTTVRDGLHAKGYTTDVVAITIPALKEFYKWIQDQSVLMKRAFDQYVRVIVNADGSVYTEERYDY